VGVHKVGVHKVGVHEQGACGTEKTQSEKFKQF